MLPLLSLSVLLAAPPLSPQSFHLMKVKEVYPGSDAAPNAQYVVLQMFSAGQNLVNGKQVLVYDARGMLAGTFTFSGNVANSLDQATLLIATPEALTFFGPLTADLAMTATLSPLGGKVCFHDPGGLGDIDCVAWGGYTGSPTGVGTPFNAPVGLVRGAAMRRRLDICGVNTNLDGCDDTGDSANDFRPAVPAPLNNAGVNGTIPASVCGNGAVQSLEQCDDGNLTPGDGCNATCLREASAFTPQAITVDANSGPSANGNGVLEPGEQVGAAPSWRNAATASLALQGALSSFTGPGGSGVTYTIVDGAADYGTVAAGATAGCLGPPCYTVAVSNPPARPVGHWDAPLAEVMSSYSAKSWSLHVGNSFTDVPNTNGTYRFVETLLHRGVTGGCSASAYCPDATVTRAQMAVFLLLSKEGPSYLPAPCTTAPFPDVPTSSPFCRWIQELSARGITGGCGGGNYCPDGPNTRGQMAVFLLLTKEGSGYLPPACASDPFGDVPASSPFCRWIQELVTRGITAGCGGGNYCPDVANTRGQMAVFLTATFGLLLYGP